MWNREVSGKICCINGLFGGLVVEKDEEWEDLDQKGEIEENRDGEE